MKHEWETKDEAAERADKGIRDEWLECKKCGVRRHHIEDDSECCGFRLNAVFEQH